LLVLVIPALSFIALLNDARKCLVSVHLTRADFEFVIPTIPPEPHQICCPISSLLTVQITLDGCLYIYLICSTFQPR
jgi:ribosomal protein RSM22 (predicted rRNA methylase)